MNEPTQDNFNGTCFEDHFILLHANSGLERAGFHFAHAMVRGSPGTPVEGWRFAHAFLINESTGAVINVNRAGELQIVPKDLYFKLGEVDPDTLRTYTLDEACRMAVSREHYGPWADDVDWKETDAEGNVYDQTKQEGRSNA